MQNLERTYILGNNQELKKLGGNFIEIPSLNTNEEDKIHDWIISLFSKNEIAKVVIEIGDNSLLALQIGYHIRLSLEDLQTKTLVPILFVSSLSLNVVMLQTGIYSQILATKGTVFSEFDLDSNKTEIKHMSGLNENEYLTQFLKIIHIQPDEAIGRHSLANIWGAYIMDKASNVNALPAKSDFKKKLYFKYILAFNDIGKLRPISLKILGNIQVGGINNIEAENKRILLIDDEAGKGWETVLRKVFKTSSPQGFVVINEKVKDFDGFSEESKRIIETDDFDLHLVDLRLNGLEEDKNLKTKEFSGMKVLQKIKSINKGNQVIIFTASNKVWNLKALLDEGADGYYMKESPEYNFSKSISEQNYKDFKENVERCLKRSYLKKTSNDMQVLINSINNSELCLSFKESIKKQLDISYFLLSKAETREQFAYAYVSLYIIIETVNSHFVEKKANGDWAIIISNEPLLDWTFNGQTQTLYSNTGTTINGDKPPEWQKLAGLYFQSWNGRDHGFIRESYYLIEKRNGFVHNDQEILNKVNSNGDFLNHDIYKVQGFIKLFELVKRILSYL